MKKEVFIKNRENLMKNIQDNSVVVLFAGEAKVKTADETYQFTPNRNFYYLTGIDEEKHTLVMSKVNGKVNSTLYILRPDPVMEKWVGKTIREEEAKEISGVEDIKFLDNFQGSLHWHLMSGNIENVYLDLEKRKYGEKFRYSYDFAQELIKEYPQISIKNVYSEITALREIKSSEEVEEMKKAIEITTKGIEGLMRNSKAGMKEYQLEAYFDFYLKQNGVKDFAFKTIAASGVNATVLHYVDNDSEIKEGDLILFDLGAQFNYYNADISRTFPVSGKFTERQKAVYEAVLKVNEEVIAMIKPGITYSDLNSKANELIGEECVKLGLLEDKKDYRKYYYHSIGHGLGLDTHDVGGKDGVLKEGMVITIEPGLYIEEEEIGIRIEDDVLVTSDGYEVLTKECIKSVEDIENFMSKI